MTDTSLKNSRGWYCQGQHARMEQFSHNMWKYKCISESTAFPCVGINMPMMTNGYNNKILSDNASDIESALFGIGSTNLVKPKAAVTPELNCMGNIKFFNRIQTYLPEPLVIQKYQRPIGPFS
jgi:hypothetical protein